MLKGAQANDKCSGILVWRASGSEPRIRGGMSFVFPSLHLPGAPTSAPWKSRERAWNLGLGQKSVPVAWRGEEELAMPIPGILDMQFRVRIRLGGNDVASCLKRPSSINSGVLGAYPTHQSTDPQMCLDAVHWLALLPPMKGARKG